MEIEYLPDEWLIELGKIVKAWISFEGLFDLLLQKLAGFNDPLDIIFTILTAHSSFPQKLDMFKSLCASHVESRPHLADYKKVAITIAEAQRVRNFFMHNMIGPGEQGPMRVSTISARGELKMKVRTINLAELREAHQKIFSAGQAMYRLVLNADPWIDQEAT